MRLVCRECIFFKGPFIYARREDDNCPQTEVRLQICNFETLTLTESSLAVRTRRKNGESRK